MIVSAEQCINMSIKQCLVHQTEDEYLITLKKSAYQDLFINMYDHLISVIVLSDETLISFVNLEKSDIQINKKQYLKYLKSSSIVSESKSEAFLSLKNIFKDLSSSLDKEFSDNSFTELSYLLYSSENDIDLNQVHIFNH